MTYITKLNRIFKILSKLSVKVGEEGKSILYFFYVNQAVS